MSLLNYIITAVVSALFGGVIGAIMHDYFTKDIKVGICPICRRNVTIETIPYKHGIMRCIRVDGRN